jgi:hypothetical protein
MTSQTEGNFNGPKDWLLDAWFSMLTDRHRTVLTRRLAGDTLADIGLGLNVSREYARQLQQKAERVLLKAQAISQPDLLHQLTMALGDSPAVPDLNVAPLVTTQATIAKDMLLRALGLARPRSWAGDLTGWWTRHPGILDTRLRDLAAAAPFSHSELEVAAEGAGLPKGLPLTDLLDHQVSPLLLHAYGWVRRGREGRDAAFLWLTAQSEPRTGAEIAHAVGWSEKALREAMRRDEAFDQVRPEGTWALADWRVAGAGSKYNSAVDVVVEVLQEFGPLPLDRLTAETIQRYPVTAWRVKQCLSSNLIGLNAAGLYDLVERGARPIEDPEPRQPDNIKVSDAGGLIGVALTVDGDVLRGSGIGVNRWLTWYLGLRHAPSERHFPYDEFPGVLTVRRGTSSSQLSSLRVPVLALNLSLGCRIAVLIRTKPDSAGLRHICSPGSCAAW